MEAVIETRISLERQPSHYFSKVAVAVKAGGHGDPGLDVPAFEASLRLKAEKINHAESDLITFLTLAAGVASLDEEVGTFHFICHRLTRLSYSYFDALAFVKQLSERADNICALLSNTPSQQSLPWKTHTRGQVKKPSITSKFRRVKACRTSV